MARLRSGRARCYLGPPPGGGAPADEVALPGDPSGSVTRAEVTMSTATAPMLTISHQYGSGGSQVARDLGERLGWSVWDKEFVRRMAAEYGLPQTDVEAKDERAASFMDKLVEILGMGGFASAYCMLPPRGLK